MGKPGGAVVVTGGQALDSSILRFGAVKDGKESGGQAEPNNESKSQNRGIECLTTDPTGDCAKV